MAISPAQSLANQFNALRGTGPSTVAIGLWRQRWAVRAESASLHLQRLTRGAGVVRDSATLRGRSGPDPGDAGRWHRLRARAGSFGRLGG